MTDYRAFLEALTPFLLGLCSGGLPFDLTWKQLQVHMAVLGGSGSGKSSFLELLHRQFLLDGLPFMLIDPHGDLSRSLMAFVAALKAEGDDVIWRKVHYVEVGPNAAVSFNPFASLPKPGDVSRLHYEALLAAKVDRVVRALLRRVSEADMEIMTRLRKWLKSILFACAAPYDDEGSHLGIDKALVFTDPDDPEFEPLLTQVWDRLPRWVQRNFEKLRAARGPRGDAVREKLESTQNRLVDVMGVLMSCVISGGRPSLNVKQVIAEGGFLIVNLAQTPTWSHDSKVTLGGLLIDEVLTAKEADENVRPSRRAPFVLTIDEFSEFLGEDLQRAFGTHRKYNMPIIIGTQDLTTLAKGDMDLAPRVLSQCGTVVCFQQTYRKDKEVIADRIGAGNLDFTRKMQLVQRQGDLLEMKLRDLSRGKGRGRSRGKSESEAESVNEVLSLMTSVMRGYADMVGSADATGTSTQTGQSDAEAMPVLFTGYDGPRILSAAPPSNLGSRSKANNRAEGGSQSHVENRAHADTGGETHAEGKTKGKTRQKGKAASETETENETEAVTEKTQLLREVLTDAEWLGLYEQGAPTDQMEMLMQRIHCLSTAEAIVAARGERGCKEVKIAHVEEWWGDEEGKDGEDDKFLAIERLKARLMELHPYWFNPSAEAEEEAEGVGPDLVVEDAENPMA